MALRFVDWPQELIDEYNYNMFGHTLVCNEKKEDTKMKKYTVKAAFADEIFGKEVSTAYIKECMRNGMPEEDVMALVAEYGDEVLDKFEIEDDEDLKKYKVTFADGTAAFIAAQSEEALGSFAILEWAAGEYDEDYDNLETDGTDIWVNENGGQRKLATVSSIEEVRGVKMTVYGRAITDRDMEAIASYMDDDIREDLHCDLAPCTHEEFLSAYLERDPEFENLLRNEFNFEMEA